MSSSPAHKTRYASLDMWRGIACLLVVAFHSTFYAREGVAPLSGVTNVVVGAFERMWIGVPLFFVISGYCISATCDSSRRQGGGVGRVLSYARRRFRRIFPPYWAWLAISLILVSVVQFALGADVLSDGNHPVPRPDQLSLTNWVGNITLTEFWRIHFFGPPDAHYFLGHAWTLGYEEQFYAATGLVLAVAPRRYFFACVAVTVLTLAMRHLGPRAGVGVNGFFFDGHWLMFALGVLVYWHLNYSARWRNFVTTGLLAIALVYSLRFPHVLTLKEASIELHMFVSALFAICLIALRPFDATTSRHPITSAMMRLGEATYSLYLVHWPVAKLTSHLLWRAGVRGAAATLLIVVPLTMALVIVIGLSFHRFVERRFLNSRPRMVSDLDEATPQLAP